MNTQSHHFDHAPRPVPLSPELLQELERKRADQRSRLAAFATAFLIHALVVTGLAWLVLTTFEPDPPVIEISPAAQGKPETKIERKDFTKMVTQKPKPTSGGASTTVISSPAPSDVQVTAVEVEADAFGLGEGEDFGAGNLSGPGGGQGLNLPPTIKGRCNQADRLKRLRENGGKPSLDRQVVKALDWLQAEQNEDGSWGTNYPVAMTGFAVLAFSGHCETIDSPRYGPTLIKAINYLVDQSRNGDGLMTTRPGQHAPYEHGIATYALAEALSLNRNARAKVKKISPALRNALPIIIEGQTEGGGWLYWSGYSGVGDLSISGWNIQALKAAELTGLKFNGLARAKKKALAYIKSAATPDGLFRYRIRDGQAGRLSLTGVGVLSARMLGETLAVEGKSFDAILAEQPRQFRAADLYALYYHSQACFQKGGEVWANYNGSNQQMVIDAQENDGSWPVAAGHIGAAKADAKVYHTCLCTLMLEVYYRYLPATDTRR